MRHGLGYGTTVWGAREVDLSESLKLQPGKNEGENEYGPLPTPALAAPNPVTPILPAALVRAAQDKFMKKKKTRFANWMLFGCFYLHSNHLSLWSPGGDADVYEILGRIC